MSSPLADHSPGAAAVATAAAAAPPLGVGGGPFPDSTRYRGGRRGAVYRAQHKSSGSTVIDFLKRGECRVRLWDEERLSPPPVNQFKDTIKVAPTKEVNETDREAELLKNK